MRGKKHRVWYGIEIQIMTVRKVIVSQGDMMEKGWFLRHRLCYLLIEKRLCPFLVVRGITPSRSYPL